MSTEKPKSPRPGSCGSFGGRRKDGQLCGQAAIAGTERCVIHAGKKTEIAKAEGRLKLAAAAWSLEDSPSAIDATAEAIRLILVTKRMHADYLAAMASEVMDKDLAALVGSSWSETGKTGEYITGIAQLEAMERDRLWRFVKDYRQAGFEESRIELAQRQVDLLDALLRGVLSDLGHDVGSPEIQGVVLRRMDALALGT